MVDKIIISISFIRSFSKKERSNEKIPAYLSKWSTQCFSNAQELLSNMTAKNQIKLVDGGYKMKGNKETHNNFDDHPNFVMKILFHIR